MKNKVTIEIQELSFCYESKTVIENLSFTVNQGELTCLLGPNGAGKSTLINLMLNRLVPKKGKIGYLEDRCSFSLVSTRVGAMLQNSTAPDRAKVFELVDLVSSYYPKPLPVPAIIQLLQLEEIQSKRFKYLSGGQKQLTLFALAICGDPDILFLDEPSANMDVSVRHRIWKVIEQLKLQGKTIVLTTHNLEEADALADRILVMKDGVFLADGKPEEIKSSFQNKRLKAKSRLSLEQLKNFPGVVNASMFGQFVQLESNHAEATLAAWFSQDPSLSDLTVASAGLEHAFIDIVTNVA